MISTSLDGMGFAPTNASLSSLAFALGTPSQDLASGGLDGGASFVGQLHQEMSFFSTSQDGSQTDCSEPEDWGSAANDQGSSCAPVETTPENSAASPGEGQEGSEEKDSSLSAASVNAATAWTGPRGIQMLLKAGSFAQVLSPSQELAVGAPGGDRAGAALNMSTGGVNVRGGGIGGQPLVTLLAASREAQSGTGPSRKGKSDAKPENAKNARVAAGNLSVGTLLFDAINSTPVTGQPGKSGTEFSSSGSGQKVLLEQGGNSRESLAAKEVGQNVSAAHGQASNLALAVRLTVVGAPAANGQLRVKESDENGAVELPEQQPMVAGSPDGQANMADSGESGTHSGEHDGELLAGAGVLLDDVAPATDQSIPSSVAQDAQDTARAVATDPQIASEIQTEPIRSVHLQLTGENNQRVDIRMVEVDGEMRVSVRAGDTKLAETLQSHIPDLAKNLDQQPLRAEIWSPRTESTSQAVAASGSGQSSPRGGDAAGQGSHQRQGNGRQQQNQPDWVDELEGYLKPNNITRSNSIWPQ